MYAIVTHMADRAATTSVLSVRVSANERALLEEASANAHTNLSDFMRRKALEAAEADVLERSTVTIPAAHWEAFEAWVESPAETIPGLEKLTRKATNRAR